MLDGIEERIVYAISEIKRLKKDGIFGSEEKDSGVVLITVEVNMYAYIIHPYVQVSMCNNVSTFLHLLQEYINILLIALECYK